MNIRFPLIKAGSGTDVWTENLSGKLTTLGLDCSIEYYSTFYQYLPYLLKYRHIYNSNFQISHCNSWNGFAFKNENPLCVTEHLVVHDPILQPYKSKGARLFHKFIFRYEKQSIELADVVTCVSNYTNEILKNVFDYHDAIVIKNGVDNYKFKPITVDKKDFLRTHNLTENTTILFFAGNLSRRKGADLLPPIMKKLGGNYLLCTTSGLRSMSSNKSNNIISLGKLHVNDLIKMYNLCDIFLFPSRLEGLPLTVAEAMSCEKPVIATDGSSLPELIVDGKGGFLCEMDNINDFVKHIRILAEDKMQKIAFGKYNRNRIENFFSLGGMAKSYLDLYKKL